MDPFRNLRLNLIARGGWAIVAVLAICVTVLGIFGQGEIASQTATALTNLLCFTVGAMAIWSRE